MKRIWDLRIAALLSEPNRTVQPGTMTAQGRSDGWFATWARLSR